MEEFIYLCIKKGANTPTKLCKKSGKAPNYLNTYLSNLRRSGIITVKCETCDNGILYKIVS